MAITYQSSHQHFYKNLSEFSMSADCNLNSNGELQLTRIDRLMLYAVDCPEHQQDFRIFKQTPVKTTKYPGFSAVTLGSTQNIWLPDTTAFELIKRDIRNNGHMLFYWDQKSVTIFTDNVTWVKVFEEFLKGSSIFHYTRNAGLFISR